MPRSTARRRIDHTVIGCRCCTAAGIARLRAPLLARAPAAPARSPGAGEDFWGRKPGPKHCRRRPHFSLVIIHRWSVRSPPARSFRGSAISGHLSLSARSQKRSSPIDRESFRVARSQGCTQGGLALCGSPARPALRTPQPGHPPVALGGARGPQEEPLVVARDR